MYQETYAFMCTIYCAQKYTNISGLWEGCHSQRQQLKVSEELFQLCWTTRPWQACQSPCHLSSTGVKELRGVFRQPGARSPVVNERHSWQGTQRSMTRLNMNIKEITHRVAHVLAGFLTPVFHPLPSGLWDGIRADILPFIGLMVQSFMCVCG